MTRTVDSEFTVSGTIIKPNVEICRSSAVIPADIANPNYDFSTVVDESPYYWMRIGGTFLNGSFVSEKVESSNSTLPKNATDIVKSNRYVRIADLQTELNIYVTEERFKELFDTVLFKEN